MSHDNYSCPHCNRHVTAPVAHFSIGAPGVSLMKTKDGGFFEVNRTVCPSCRKSRIILWRVVFRNGGRKVADKLQVWPFNTSGRPSPPTEVPTDISKDYIEAASVLATSPKASAALSRRILQHVLRDHLGYKARDLADQIQQILDKGNLPSALADSLDAVRNIGNFAAHPMKSKNSGQIVEVEPGEAEWTLDVLDLLFDFAFVQPAVARSRRDALNKKLAAAGKPLLKGTAPESEPSKTGQ